MTLDRPNPLHVLVLTSVTDARDRAALLTPVLDHARAVVQVHRMPEGGDLNCRGDLPNPINTPNIIVLFHGGIRTAARIKTLQKRFNCPVVLRLGGRNDLAALDLARGAVGSLRMGKALRRVANAALDRRTLRAADGCICVTEALSMWVHGCTAKPVITCPPVRMPLVSPAPDLTERASRTILTVSNLKYRAKLAGIRRLLPCFERVASVLPDVTWRIVGNGPLLMKLKRQMVRSPHWSKITMVGWSDDVEGALGTASQFWYASRLDAYPLVVSEAIWAGLPTLVEAGTPSGAMAPADCAFACDDGWADRSVDLLTDADLRRRVTAATLDHVRRVESPSRLSIAFVPWIRALIGHRA